MQHDEARGDTSRAAQSAPDTARHRTSSRVTVQARLVVGASNDRHEQEADRVAHAVMRVLRRAGSSPSELPGNDRNTRVEPMRGQNPSRTAAVRSASPETRIQPRRHAGPIGLDGGEVDHHTDRAIRAAKGSGAPLADSIRGPMESAFGADFSGVRVHSDARAADLNQRIQAKAFTTGSDVFFSPGQYQPGSRGGQELLAHELTHVVQQGAAGVARRRTKITRAPVEGGVIRRMDDDSDADAFYAKYSFGSGSNPYAQEFNVDLEGAGGEDDTRDYTYRAKQFRVAFARGTYEALFKAQFNGGQLRCGLGAACPVNGGVIALNPDGTEDYTTEGCGPYKNITKPHIDHFGPDWKDRLRAIENKGLPVGDFIDAVRVAYSKGPLRILHKACNLSRPK